MAGEMDGPSYRSPFGGPGPVQGSVNMHGTNHPLTHDHRHWPSQDTWRGHDENPMIFILATTAGEGNHRANTRNRRRRLHRRQNNSDFHEGKEARKDAETERSDKWRDLVVQFTQDTTLHGIRYTTLDTRFVIVRRFLWTIVILSALGVFTFYMYERLDMYFKYKKNVSVEENYVGSMTFPAITICNQNPFRLTTSAIAGWYQIAKELTTVEGEPVDLRKCVSGEFSCRTGACIPIDRVCDAFPDCKDDSDEQDCPLCLRLQVLASAGSTFKVNHVTGEDFDLQESTYNSHLPVYVKKNVNSPVFLYFDNNKEMWTFSNKFGNGTIYATTSDNATSPQTITAPWRVPQGPSGTLKIRCSDQMIEAPLSGSTGWNLPLDDLYDSAAEPADDLIESCSWKGNPCSVADFQRRITDMGVCYTFGKEGLTVQRSGPGFGLSVTLNIEQFEYTKDPQNGVGIRVLLHDPIDVPMMQGRAFAISPGLNTMVAIEKTAVTNLVPPWGNCSTKTLQYYDVYTVTTCQMDCENVMAREKCNCRDVNMPQKGPNDKPVCTVQQYISCLLPKLILMRKTVDACICPTPCEETIYLASLSFASISSDDDTIKRRQREEKFSIMQGRLKLAREISYRVNDDKYRATQRTFRRTELRVSQVLWLVLGMKDQLADTLASITSIGREVTTDCLWFSKFQYEQANILKYGTRHAIQTYQEVFRTQVLMSMILFHDTVVAMDDGYSSNEHAFLNTRTGKVQFSEYNTNVQLKNLTLTVDTVKFLTKNNITITTEASMSAVVDANTTIDLLDNVTLNIEKGSAFFADLDISGIAGTMTGAHAQVWLSDDAFWNHTSEVWLRFSTLRTAYRYTKSMLKEVASSTETELKASLKSLTDSDYVLRHQRADFLLNQSRISCLWCQTADDSPLIVLTRTKLLEYINNTLLVGLAQVETTLDQIYNDWLIAEVGKDQVTKDIIKTTRLPQLIAATRQLYEGMEENLHNTALEAAHLLDEMLRLLTPKCETELPKKLMEYQDAHLRITSSIEVMITGITSYGTDLEKYKLAYLSSNMTLEQFDTTIQKTGVLNTMDNAATSTASSLRDSAQALVRVDEHINMLYYWFLAQANDSFLAQNSQYWKYFNIESAEVAMPTGAKMETMVQGERIRSFWNGLKSRLSLMESNIAYHIPRLKRVLTDSYNYLKNFKDGNTLDEKFFKKNFLQMDIFYKALTDKKVSQQKAYEYPALLSELGGLMGLLLGASCLTIFEFIDLLIYNLSVKCSEHWATRSSAIKKTENSRPRARRGQHHPGGKTPASHYPMT